MAENSKIEWTDHTFNAWVGCTKVSGACDFCYAEGWAKRTGHPELWNGKRRQTSPAYWLQPLKWNAAAEAARKRARVFCCSLADVFDNQAPQEWRNDLFNLIYRTPWLEWQLLTKRPQNILKMVKAAGGLPSNAALGTTTEDQKEANRRVRHLQRAAAKLRPLYSFLSCEPLIGPVDLYEAGAIVMRGDCIPDEDLSIDWVICGGESGGKARPMHPDWARSLRDQCAAAGIPYHFKQWGEWAPGENCGAAPTRTERTADWFANRWHFSAVTPKASEEGHRDDEPDVYRIGKKRAGRHLDGVEHNGMPA